MMNNSLNIWKSISQDLQVPMKTKLIKKDYINWWNIFRLQMFHIYSWLITSIVDDEIIFWNITMWNYSHLLKWMGIESLRFCHEYLYTLQDISWLIVIGITTELYCDLKHWKGHQLTMSQCDNALKMKTQEYIFMDNLRMWWSFLFILNNQRNPSKG